MAQESLHHLKQLQQQVLGVLGAAALLKPQQQMDKQRQQQG